MRLPFLMLLATLAGCASTTRTTPERGPACTTALRMEEASRPPGGPDDAAPSVDPDTPHTALSLVLLCEDRAPEVLPLGTEIGACFAIERPAGALLAARCWWGGAGAVWVVAREDYERDGALVARRAASDEMDAAPRELEPVASLPLPPRARVSALEAH